MNKSTMLGASSMTPIERQMGRFMRGPDHPGDTGGDEGTDNNNGDDSLDDGNNSSQEDELASFWGESDADAKPDGGGDGDESKPPNFMEAIQAMSFGDGVMTEDAVAGLNEGNTEKFESNLQAFGKDMATKMFGTQVQVLELFGNRMLEEVEKRINSNANTREDTGFLETNFPSAKNPQVRPVVQKVFDQALKNSNGNREQAVATTKSMLKIMADVTQEDLGISVDSNQERRQTKPKKTDWLDMVKTELQQ